MADVRQLEVLLKLLHSVGSQLAEGEGAYHRAWGRHLLEDWRGLELLTDKLRMTGLDGAEEVPATEHLVEETPVQATQL